MMAEGMRGRLHGFAALGEDQIRFESAAETHFADIERAHKVRLMRPFAVRRQFFGNVDGFVAETFETGTPT